MSRCMSVSALRESDLESRTNTCATGEPRPGGGARSLADQRAPHRPRRPGRASTPSDLQIAQHDAAHHEHVAIAEIGLLDAATVDVGAVGATVVENPHARAVV